MANIVLSNLSGIGCCYKEKKKEKSYISLDWKGVLS